MEVDGWRRSGSGGGVTFESDLCGPDLHGPGTLAVEVVEVPVAGEPEVGSSGADEMIGVRSVHRGHVLMVGMTPGCKVVSLLDDASHGGGAATEVINGGNFGLGPDLTGIKPESPTVDGQVFALVDIDALASAGGEECDIAHINGPMLGESHHEGEDHPVVAVNVVDAGSDLEPFGDGT